jgi:hypothetical protein
MVDWLSKTYLNKINISLLRKWWWKLENKNGIWQELIKKKYLKHRLDDSPIWGDLLKVRQVCLRGRLIHVKNGKQTLFWEDAWLRDKPLCELYPILYDWCYEKKKITVFGVLEKKWSLRLQ